MATATRSAPRETARRAPTDAQVQARVRRAAARALPDWDALAGSDAAPRVARANGRVSGGQRQATQRADAKRRESSKAAPARRLRPLDAVPSLRAGLWTILACVVITLFVSHVYATRDALDALQEARRDNERLRLTQRRLAGAFDRMTAPDRVMPRALALGLVEGVAYGPTVVVVDPVP